MKNSPPPTSPPPPGLPRIAGATMLAWGVLQPGEERTITHQRPLPDGVSVTIFSPDRRGKNLSITKQDEAGVTFGNHGQEVASFMLFAVTARAARVLDGMRMLASAILHHPPKDPTP